MGFSYRVNPYGIPTKAYNTGYLGTQMIVTSPPPHPPHFLSWETLITGYVFINKRTRTDKSANSCIGYDRLQREDIVNLYGKCSVFFPLWQALEREGKGCFRCVRSNLGGARKEKGARVPLLPSTSRAVSRLNPLSFSFERQPRVLELIKLSYNYIYLPS